MKGQAGASDQDTRGSLVERPSRGLLLTARAPAQGCPQGSLGPGTLGPAPSPHPATPKLGAAAPLAHRPELVVDSFTRWFVPTFLSLFTGTPLRAPGGWPAIGGPVPRALPWREPLPAGQHEKNSWPCGRQHQSQWTPDGPQGGGGAPSGGRGWRGMQGRGPGHRASGRGEQGFLGQTQGVGGAGRGREGPRRDTRGQAVWRQAPFSQGRGHEGDSNGGWGLEA